MPLTAVYEHSLRLLRHADSTDRAPGPGGRAAGAGTTRCLDLQAGLLICWPVDNSRGARSRPGAARGLSWPVQTLLQRGIRLALSGSRRPTPRAPKLSEQAFQRSGCTAAAAGARRPGGRIGSELTPSATATELVFRYRRCSVPTQCGPTAGQPDAQSKPSLKQQFMPEAVLGEVGL